MALRSFLQNVSNVFRPQPAQQVRYKSPFSAAAQAIQRTQAYQSGQEIRYEPQMGPTGKPTGSIYYQVQGAGGGSGGGADGGIGGQKGGIGGQNMYAGFDTGSYLESMPEAPGFDWDAFIAPALEALGQAETAAQSSYTADVTDIERERATSIGRQKTYQTGEETRAVGEKTKKEQAGESAVAEARRQYGEIQQGLQGLYGGSTGTGAFATELAGRETLRNIGGVRQQVTNALSEIDDRLGQVRQMTQLNIEDAENQALSFKAKAKASLDQSLAQIRSSRGELQSRKAEMAMSAMQNYQNLVANINARNAAFKQQVAMQAQSVEQTLANARTRAAGIAQNYLTEPLEMFRQATPLLPPGYGATYNIPYGTGRLSIAPQRAETEEDQFLRSLQAGG